MAETRIAEGATVLDPYMGSGTTGIACIRTGRKFIGIEKSAEYFEIARQRLENELRQGLLPLTHNKVLSVSGERKETNANT
jgi:site-specific DNA-methyltransferase (adenine-specific)